MDRMDPTNFDSLEHERRTTVRGLEIEHFPDGDNPWARGHDFRLSFDVGLNTSYSVTANAKELRRWAMLIAEAVTRLYPEQEMCPDRVRALHRPVEYRPGDHYANYGPPSKRDVLRGADKRPEVVTVCEECQAQIDELLLSESGGYGSWELAEFPCRTILAADGKEL